MRALIPMFLFESINPFNQYQSPPFSFRCPELANLQVLRSCHIVDIVHSWEVTEPF
jgi:hypothetical protein